VTAQEAKAAGEFGGAAEDSGGTPAVALTDKQVAGQYKLITGTANSDGYGQRLINWGRWFAFLFWQPFRAANSMRSLSLVCNGALYGLEVSVERSPDLYASYEAGLNQNLIAAAKYLADRGVRDGQVAVSSRYQNLGRTRSSPFGLRAATMLTGRAIVSVPWQ